MEQIIIRLIPLQGTVRGFTVVDEDGNYNMYLNENGDIKQAFIHELGHILNNDFYNDEVIGVIESRNPCAKVAVTK